MYLNGIGLPTENVLYPTLDRVNILKALSDAIEILPIDQRSKSYYLTKFAVAVTVGLFDGALNYLWDETIGALRRLAINFDIQYLFSILGKINSRYKNFNNFEDLAEISDHDLLEACRRIGLLSDVNYRRLEIVNYMRNHASAAHPNDNEIDGFEMLGWLRSCLKYAIIAEPEHSVIHIKQLLENIRNVSIPATDALIIGNDIAKLPQERIDDLLWTLFGIYTDIKQDVTTKSNIENIAKYVWDCSSQDRKYEVGAKYGVFRKNGDVQRKQETQRFLTFVDGLAYKDEDSLAGELLEKLETLKSVHFAWNNFHNEYLHAKSLKDAIPANGQIPRAAKSLWVKVITIGYIGNGKGHRHGVDEAALPYYEEYIQNFSDPEISIFLYLMSDPEFTLNLGLPKSDNRLKNLAIQLKNNASNVHIKNTLDIIISSGIKMNSLASDSAYKQAIKYVPKNK